MELDCSVSPAWLADLNEAQIAAVTHVGGPLLILAGAGTGKTRTLVSRMAWLIANGVAPGRILLVAFSRRAAREMTQRAALLSGGAPTEAVEAGTFHAVANRVLRRHSAALGLADGFSVLGSGDAADLMHMASEERPDRSRRFPRSETLVSIYSRVVNTGMPLAEVISRHFPWCGADIAMVASAFDLYTERKRAQGLLDYDDLLLFWRAALADDHIGPVLAGAYDHILVDEYQDTNAVQCEILRHLRSANDNITVVGDDAQSIYSFRAATIRNILDFGQHFPGHKMVVLDQSYRSTQPVLDLANQILADADDDAGFRKALWSKEPGGGRPILSVCPDEVAQSTAVCDTILEHFDSGMALRDQVVLFRAGHHSDLLEVELGLRHIPFVKYGGLRFVDTAHVRDVLAMLRILENPWDELGWHRTLLLVDGVGPRIARRLLSEIGVRPRRAGSSDPLTLFLGANRPRLPRADADLQVLADALRACAHDDLGLGEQLNKLLSVLDPIIRRRYDHVDARLSDLSQLAQLASGFASRQDLVTELTLDPPASSGDLAGAPVLDDDYITLSTVHSAKGGEWSAVHLIHLADGMFPSDMATGDASGVNEERRLFYVAVTRARRYLHMYAPARYYHGGSRGSGDSHSRALRSRFLPIALEHLLELRAVRSLELDTVSESAVGLHHRSGADDIGTRTIGTTVDAQLKALW